jgi:hypothetical protein
MMTLLAAAENASETDWLAVVIAAFALLVAGVAAYYNWRSTAAAEASSQAAKDSAAASNVSANAAADLLRVELDREHDDYSPKPNGKFTFEPRSASPHLKVLTYRFTLDRPYRVIATAASMNNKSTTVCSVTTPGRPDGDYLVSIEDWSADRKDSAWRELTLRFWPPQAQEGRARPWTCRCGLDVNQGDHAGHWDWSVKIEPPKPTIIHSGRRVN